MPSIRVLGIGAGWAISCDWVLVVLSALLPPAVEAGEAGKGITVVIRYDDPSATSSTETETKLIDAFRRYNMCCTFAVIPFVCAGDPRNPRPQACLPLPEEKAQLFTLAAREGVIEVAQHGYSHQTNQLHPKEHSEFAGLGYDEQLQKIEEGKGLLERELGLSVLTFVPPWNSYDAETVRAIEQAGFQCLSAYGTGTVGPASPLRFLPVTCGIREIRDAVSVARTLSDPTPVVVVLFHGYDFREVSSARGVMAFDDFERTLAWLSRQADIDVRPTAAIQGMDRSRYVGNQRILRTRELLPVWLCGGLPASVYLSEQAARHMRPRCILLLAEFYGGVLSAAAILTFILAAVFFPRMPGMMSRLALLSGPPLLIGGSVWTFHDGQFGARGLLAVGCILGYCVGTWVACLSRRRRARVWNRPAQLERREGKDVV
jgi:peptidoglycan/xylan/chitin deacetylase (PgdA/CDA1 family)